MKELDLTFASIANQNAKLEREALATQKEIKERNARARAYSKSKRKFKKLVKRILKVAAIVGVLFLVGSKVANAEYRYAVKSENELGYEYVTEVLCEIREVNGEIVTVEYKGNQYDFKVDSYAVGEEVVCKFTDNMEIIGVK